MQGVRDEEYDIEQGQKLAKISFDFSICGNCHIPKRHEMREELLKEAAAKEAAAKEAVVGAEYPKAEQPKAEQPE
jgi:hypothetical protein